MTTNANRYFKRDDTNTTYNPAFEGNPKKVGDESKLDAVTLDVLGFTPASVKDQLLGMERDLIDPATGKEYTDEQYRGWIYRGVATAEKEFNIVIRPRVVNERVDFNQSEFNSNMSVVAAERPILQVDELSLQYANQTIFTVPDQWLKVSNLFGQVEIQPNLMVAGSTGVIPQTILFSGVPVGQTNDAFLQYPQFAPQMIGMRYVAGMLPQPPEKAGINRFWYPHPDLIAYVAKIATIELLERWGKTILGAGIAGYGISIDGISTNVDSTQSAENTGSTADIKLLQADMKDIKNALKAYYGQTIGVLA